MALKRCYALAAASLAVSLVTSGAFTFKAPFESLSTGTARNALFGGKPAFTHELSMSSVAEPSTSTALDDYVSSRGGNLPIRKILIANNGMAATKSILSMRQWAYMELGDEKAIQFVAMATAEDLKANAEFVRLADTFVEVPAGKNLNNYANVEVITKIAQEQGVDAVWPGWGHASENPALPTTLKKMGIKFIGPTAPVMSVLGDKIAANILAQTAGVSSIPWSGSYGGPDDGPLQAELNEEGTIPTNIFESATCRNVDEAVEAAKKIGYENGIMIKASEGGGGKGIRFVDNEEDLKNAYVQVENEVIGSPIFLMQLCKNARHIEVQIVGDEHGNAVALNGRDCSTQRRFQKIFEEAPPAIVPADTFKEMERAAQRLTQSIGYIGAGTVEYLYNADTDVFYFLELNPRLQVEHPVTEGITNTNMPSNQLQVAMGIPLYNIPAIRKLYGKADVYGTDPIDFLEEDYLPIDTHVIAARITAENPDEGFKPTSGSIERIKFQSTPEVWGYFSVGSNGGIHEFADSQFGHLFAKGPTREAARKSLVLALKEIEVKGEIRTTVEYLVQLLETDDFKNNAIDTAWLDGLIKEKSVYVEKPEQDVVLGAAILKAREHVKTETAAVVESFEKGQVSTGSIPGITNFSLEIAYKDTKYNFNVELTAPDVYRFTINGKSIDVPVTVTTDGPLVASFGGETHRIDGQDEPLGLRLSLDGVTILMPTIFDPSELRTDVTGKVVRYLQDNGADVESGEPYVEVEAMKMIMPIRASESGKITHALSPGTVISAGDMLASLELKDPSKVKKIVNFEGVFDVSSEDIEMDSQTAVTNILAGFTSDADAVAQNVIAGIDDVETATSVIVGALNEYLRVETIFDGKLKDDVVRTLAKDNADSLETVIDINRAHQLAGNRNSLVQGLLRQVETFPDRFGENAFSDELLEVLGNIADLEGKTYGETSLSADAIIRQSKVPPFDVRVDELRNTLLADGTDFDELSKSAGLSAGVDLLVSLLSDADAKVRAAATEVYVRRVYRAHRVIELDVNDVDGRIQCSWKFRFADVPESQAVVRNGFLEVVPGALNDALPKILDDFSSKLDGTPPTDFPVNVLHFALLSGEDVESQEKAIVSQQSKLNMLGLRTVNSIVPVDKKDPEYFSFPQCNDYKEDAIRRDMRPTFHHLLELGRLDENFELERLPSAVKNVQVYVGNEKTSRPVRGGPPQVLFVRGISNTPGIVSLAGARRSLVQGLDELERAQANSKVSPQASSRIFLHSLPEIEGDPVDVAEKFQSVMDALKSRLASRLLKLSVDEIEVKIRLKGTDDEGKPTVIPVRLVASSMEGEWLKTTAFIERPDPVTGVTREFCIIGDQDNVCVLDPYLSSNVIQTKRAIARRVGSTYAYDFLGLLQVGLIGEWDEYLNSLEGQNTSDALSAGIPTGIFSSQELIENENGDLVPGNRAIGTNQVGMVAWVITMKTPEYPEGRDVVFIANDVTVKSGSFGVEEDEVYYKASQYARANGLPRVYIACNAGARIGLYDALKEKINLKFYDADSPAKGFEYLYLTDEDYKTLPEGAVNAHQVPEGWAVDDIIGEVHGIGVENLQGSGKIAGETSRAYDEVFTLSYVTGRSVGIGAYLNRLGQRIIQMKQGPMILTGFSALNKLLGRDVYNSQDQLGGPQIMVPNGVTHETVDNDQEGVSSILKWLNYVPKDASAATPARECADPVDRDVTWRPTPTPYDPRLMLSGDDSGAGFFDKDSFKEYLAGWGKSVIVGRGRLGGVPMGAIAVETRLVEQVVPADPADVNSREAILPQAGQVLFPDSSFKTAQAIRDFNNEGLPIMIFANWRGFSGGSRDMAGEILKFGAQIVDALREYEHPVYIYLPPHGELRGGSWVVVDPTINEEKMTMYADPDSRGGILEPAGIAEVKFRTPDQLKVMHRVDPQLQLLDSEMEMSDGTDVEAQASIKDQIVAREELLKPVFLQAATEFCDLHDKTGRMKAKGVIESAVPWDRSREFFYYTVKRRIAQDSVVDRLIDADDTLTPDSARAIVKGMCSADWEDNKATLAFFNDSAADIDAKVADVKKAAIEAKIAALQGQL